MKRNAQQFVSNFNADCTLPGALIWCVYRFNQERNSSLVGFVLGYNQVAEMMHLVLSLAAMRNAMTSHFNARVTDTERKTGFPAEHKNPQRKGKVEC